jgi:hypothetical protein
MNGKRALLSLLALSAALVLVLSGCSNVFGGDDDDDDDSGGGVQEGDVLAGGFEVQTVDPAGGYIAHRQWDADGDGFDASENTDELQGLVTGTFTDDVTLSSDRTWFLEGAVFIGNNENADNTLTIDPGTTIKGETSSTNPGLLVITRGSQINAAGTSSEPIVMTSAKDDQVTASGIESNAAPGDWGGIVINGYAPVQGGTAEGEGSTGTYGGGSNPVPDDNSGTMRYVRVQFAGTLFSPDNELNGIAFQGVGSGSTFEYIQVHRNADDGIEFFGGTAQVKYYVGTGIQDDSIDHDDGWNGSVQYAVVQQYDDGDHMIEGDGDVPESGQIDAVSAVITNVTFIGNSGSSGDLFFRRGAKPTIHNSILYNTAPTAITENDAGDSGSAAAGDVVYQGVVIHDADNDTGAQPTVATGVNFPSGGDSSNNAFESVTFSGGSPVYNDGAANNGFNATHNAVSQSPAAYPDPLEDPAGNSLDDAGYIGAVDPNGDDWTAGWTAFPDD